MTQRTTKQLKLRRGNTAEHANFVGALGEITIDTDLKTIRVHDGTTQGGIPLMRGDATINSIPWSNITNRPTLFSGNYADLTNKPNIPTVPTNVSAFTNDSQYVTSQQLSNSTAGVVQLLTNSLSLKANLDQIPVVPNLGDITINGSQISAVTGVIELNGSSYAKLTGSNNYIFVNDVVGTKISLNDQETEWTFDTNGNLTLPEGGDILNSNGQSVLGGNANTGNVTFDGIKVIGYGTASGDGAGYATLELVPDNSLYSNGQYLVIDPTAPSHIHIRAGGLQDQSSADLFLGGEKNHVRIRDNQGIRLQNLQTTDNNWYYADTSDFTAGAWYTESENHYIEFTTTNPEMVSRFWDFTIGGQNRVRLNDGDEIEYGGWADNSTPNVYKVQVLTAPPASPTALTSIEFHIFVDNTNYIELQNNDFRVDVQDDIRMFGRDIFRLANYSSDEPIQIITNYDNNSYTWAFNPNGTLNFPDGSTQLTAFTGVPVDTDTLDSVTDRGAITTNNITVGAVITTDITNKVTPAVGGQVTGVRYWDGAGVNLYVWLNAAATPELVTLNSFGDITGWTVSVSDGNSATVTATNPQGFFTISTDQPLTGTGTLTFTSPNYAPETSLPIDINVGTNTWTFGTDGGITFPTLTVNLHNGGNQQGQVLQFSDVSRQAIITGPTPILGQSAQRLIIQGQNGGTGEGGDVYLWAGDSDSNGGDIKIYAGDADAVPGNGGYINIDAGNGYAQGGHLSLSAGNSALYGGNVTISAGSASQGTAGQVQLSTAGGSVNLAPDGNFTISKNVVLSKPVSIVTQSVTGTVYDNQQNPFTFRILKSANPQLSAAFADPNFVLRWTGTDEGSQAAAQQAPNGMGNGSLVSDDGTFWNFNSWFGLNGFNLAGSIFTVEYGMQVNYTTISTTNTNLRLQAGNKHWTFDALGNLELPDDGEINYSPATPSDWSGTPPTTIQEAIDRLAALVKSLNSGTGA